MQLLLSKITLKSALQGIYCVLTYGLLLYGAGTWTGGDRI